MFAARFNFPRFKGIYDARLHHDNITPIRGTDIRPIGSRKRKDVSIRTEGDNVVLRFYDTDVVTFLSNGDIHVDLGGWVTQSTRNFIYTALAGCFIAHRRMWIQTVKGWQALRPQDVNILRRTEGGTLEFLNAIELKTHTINRTEANNVRKRYAPFNSYVKRMFKLADPDGKKASVSRSAMSELFSGEHGVPRHLGVSGDRIAPTQAAMDFLELAGSTDTADHYKAWAWLVFSSGYPSYQSDDHFCHYNHTIKLLDDLILWVNRGECFDEVDAPTGEAVRDRYGKFFG